MDREKVIKGLEVCTSIAEGESCPKECPYYQEVCYGHDQLMRDALALLKEQEHKDKMFRALEEDWKRLKEQVAETELCDRCGRRRLKSKRDGR